VEQQNGPTFALFTDEDVLTVYDDSLAFRFVLFDQPWLSHTGTASMGLAKA
jgi:hypothetical protein